MAKEPSRGVFRSLTEKFLHFHSIMIQRLSALLNQDWHTTTKTCGQKLNPEDATSHITTTLEEESN